MTTAAKLARSFAIFAEYGDDEVHAEHDQLWAGPEPSHVSAEHVAELESLGWTPDPDGTWHRWV